MSVINSNVTSIVSVMKKKGCVLTFSSQGKKLLSEKANK